MSQILRPSHTLDPIWRLLQQVPNGIIQLCGAAGTGKTTVVEALEREARGRALATVVCRLGERATLTFLSTFLLDELRSCGVRSVLGQVAYRAAADRGLETRQAQVAACLASRPAPSLHGFLQALMESNHLERLVVVLEDLDLYSRTLGISRPCAEALVPEGLPPGCFLVLTLEAPWLAGAQVHNFNLNGPEHSRFLRRLVSRRLTQAKAVEAVLSGCQGKAIYLELLLRGLEHGLLEGHDLPAGAAILPALMDGIRERAGQTAYRQIHLPVLHLLANSRQRVSPALLRRWGVSEEGLQMALFDMRHLLDGIDVDRPNRLLHAPPLTLAHRILHKDALGHGPWKLPARWAEQQILKCRPQGFSTSESPAWYEVCVQIFEQELGGLGERTIAPCLPIPALLREEAECHLYNLLFSLPHLERLGEEAVRLRHDPGYAKELWRLGIRSFRSSPLSASYLLGASCSLFESMGDQEEELAGRLLDWSAVLSNLEWFAESAKSSRTSCGVFCQLLERGSQEVKGSLARSLKNLGVSLRALQQPQEADLAYRAAARLLRELGRWSELATLLINRGNALWDIGQQKDALDCLQESLQLLRQEHPPDPMEMATVLELIADRQEELDHLEAALSSCEEALAICLEMPGEEARRRLLQMRRGCLMARLQLQAPVGASSLCSGPGYTVEDALRQALQPGEEGQPQLEPDDLAHAARCLRDLGSELAVSFYQKAVAGYEERVAQGRGRLRRELALCQLELGQLKQDRGRGGRAALVQAHRLLKQLVDQGHGDLAEALRECKDALGED